MLKPEKYKTLTSLKPLTNIRIINNYVKKFTICVRELIIDYTKTTK